MQYQLHPSEKNHTYFSLIYQVRYFGTKSDGPATFQGTQDIYENLSGTLATFFPQSQLQYVLLLRPFLSILHVYLGKVAWVIT